jgi:hypothetical protein
MALAAWARAVGGGVTLVACWRRRVTKGETGSSGGRRVPERTAPPPRRHDSAHRGQGVGEVW